MFLNPQKFDPATTVNDIVTQDYRTAEIFKKHGIEFCCGGKFPLEVACLSRGLETSALVKELKEATREIRLPSDPGYMEWPVDFLIDYIINLHHRYIRKTVPDIGEHLKDFILEHEVKIPGISVLGNLYQNLSDEILPHIRDEEETIFPYIRQLAHAFQNREPYAVLLVRTLRKPVHKMMHDEQEKMAWLLLQIRQFTNNYTPPEKSCVNHRVVFSRLKELDQDLSQHLYLENDILFPRTLEMEQVLLDEPLR